MRVLNDFFKVCFIHHLPYQLISGFFLRCLHFKENWKGEKEKTRVNKLRHTVYIYTQKGKKRERKKKTTSGFLGPSNIHALGGTIEKSRTGEGRGKMSNWIQTNCFLFDDWKVNSFLNFGVPKEKNIGGGRQKRELEITQCFSKSFGMNRVFVLLTSTDTKDKGKVVEVDN